MYIQRSPLQPDVAKSDFMIIQDDYTFQASSRRRVSYQVCCMLEKKFPSYSLFEAIGKLRRSEAQLMLVTDSALAVVSVHR